MEIEIPRGKPQFAVEHRDPVAHIVEGDAQLGLAVAQLLEQARVLDRDHRLVREGGGQLDLRVGERLDARAGDNKDTDHRVFAQKRNAEHRAGASKLDRSRKSVFRVLQDVRDMHDPTLQSHSADRRAATWCRGVSDEKFLRLR